MHSPYLRSVSTFPRFVCKVKVLFSPLRNTFERLPGPCLQGAGGVCYSPRYLDLSKSLKGRVWPLTGSQLLALLEEELETLLGGKPAEISGLALSRVGFPEKKRAASTSPLPPKVVCEMLLHLVCAWPLATLGFVFLSGATARPATRDLSFLPDPSTWLPPFGWCSHLTPTAATLQA